MKELLGRSSGARGPDRAEGLGAQHECRLSFRDLRVRDSPPDVIDPVYIAARARRGSAGTPLPDPGQRRVHQEHDRQEQERQRGREVSGGTPNLNCLNPGPFST